MKNKSIKEIAAGHYKSVKAATEKLNLQLHLGSKELNESFESRKKEMGKWIDSAEQKLKEAEGLSAEKATEIKTKLEALRVQAALGKADTEDAMKAQQKEIAASLHHLKYSLKDLDAKTETKFKAWLVEMNDELSDFEMSFDMFRLQLHLGKEEALKLWDEKKKEIGNKLHQLENELQKDKENISEKLDLFQNEMSAAWKHMKKSIGK